MSNTTRNTRIILGSALLAGMAAAAASTGVNSGNSNLFSVTDLGHGYMVAAVGESKCGSNKAPVEAKCGADKAQKAQQAAEKETQMKEIREAKCGEAKCGSNKGN